MGAAVVQRARLSDAAEIARIHTLGWRKGFAGLLSSEYLAGRVVGEEVWRERVSEPHPYAVFVARPAGDPDDAPLSGFAAVGPALEPAPVGDLIGQLYSIYVQPEIWGTGVGYDLHAVAVDALRDASFEEAVLWHLEGNTRALSFYRRQGWQETSTTRTEDLGGTIAHERLLRLELADRAGRPSRAVRVSDG